MCCCTLKFHVWRKGGAEPVSLIYRFEHSRARMKSMAPAAAAAAASIARGWRGDETKKGVFWPILHVRAWTLWLSSSSDCVDGTESLAMTDWLCGQRGIASYACAVLYYILLRASRILRMRLHMCLLYQKGFAYIYKLLRASGFMQMNRRRCLATTTTDSCIWNSQMVCVCAAAAGDVQLVTCACGCTRIQIPNTRISHIYNIYNNKLCFHFVCVSYIEWDILYLEAVYLCGGTALHMHANGYPWRSLVRSLCVLCCVAAYTHCEHICVQTPLSESIVCNEIYCSLSSLLAGI